MSSITSLQQRALSTNEWPVFEKDGLSLIRSPLLSRFNSLVHAFTTRLGGTSASPLNWFNLGRHYDDEAIRSDAMRNRDKLCSALGLDYGRLTVPGQQHTTNIFVLDEQSAPGQLLPNFDATSTARAGFPVLLHFADCVPIILYDGKNNVLCVVHAGWRGTAGGIVTKAVQTMENIFQSQPSDICAAIGPAIGRCCYQTGSEVVEQLRTTVNSSTAELVEMRDGSPYPELKAFNALQLLEMGVQQIDVSAWCTACHPEIFYSHRQSGGQTGRQGAIACLQ